MNVGFEDRRFVRGTRAHAYQSGQAGLLQGSRLSKFVPTQGRQDLGRVAGVGGWQRGPAQEVGPDLSTQTTDDLHWASGKAGARCVSRRRMARGERTRKLLIPRYVCG